MKRKKIILCLDETADCDPIEKFVSQYFVDKPRLIRINFSAGKSCSRELASARSITSNYDFPDSCNQSDWITSYGHFDSDAIFRKIYQEARFSDLLVIGESHYRWLCYQEGGQEKSSVNNSSIFCPKLIVPSQKASVDQIIIVDDGHPDTHGQIKYLSCMFSNLCMSLPTVLLTIQNQQKSLPLREERLWIDYLKTHFADLAVHRLDEQSVNTLRFTVDFTKNTLLIGAFSNLTMLKELVNPRKHFRLIG